ncbi:PUA-like domain-containing protein [Spinellus fusiger]|nr:PUA-like domain-containing protein [Spinellus fusiger]
MAIFICVPSRKQQKYKIDTSPNEKVSVFRELVAKKLEKKSDTFRLIAMGKMLEDKCADNTPATLFVTYRLKANTTVIAHFKSVSDAYIPEETQQDTPETSDTVPVETEESADFIQDYMCETCKNDENALECSECGCSKCKLKSGNPLICDQCNEYWHLECVGLEKEPEEDDWYCPLCVNTDVDAVVGLGKGVDMKNSKIAKSNAAKQTKMWGGGVSCSGRETECVIVPKTHVGAIPGIRCGQTWTYRMKCSEWGVHRSPVGGISGTTSTGAVSVVLSNGYEDDKDDGETFFYTGSGGRNLSGNKRVGNHCDDQELTRFNLSLAMTCAAEVNDEVGAEAQDWKQSRPIRVCRTVQLARHNPTYAPTEGVRYDGLYKIVKYWPDTGKSGHRVWRFLFRRDDPEPAPWTNAGKKIIEKHGLRTIVQESRQIKQLIRYTIPKDIVRLMNADKADKRMWDELKTLSFWSEYEFLHHVFSEAVVCTSGACSNPIKDPITTPCGHICCKKCMKQDVSNTCFSCRSDMTDFKKKPDHINKNLEAVLKACNWAYGVDTNFSLPCTSTKKPTNKSSKKVDTKSVDTKEKGKRKEVEDKTESPSSTRPKRTRSRR